MLESQRPLAEAAVLAFSVSFEMDYFHVVATAAARRHPPAGRRARRARPAGDAGRAGGRRLTPSRWRRWPTPSSSARPSELLAALVERAARRLGRRRPRGVAGGSERACRACTCRAHLEWQPVQRRCLHNLDAWPTHSAILAPQRRVRRHAPDRDLARLRARLPLLPGRLPGIARTRERIAGEHPGAGAQALARRAQKVGPGGGGGVGLPRDRRAGGAAARRWALAISVSSLRVRPLSPVLCARWRIAAPIASPWRPRPARSGCGGDPQGHRRTTDMLAPPSWLAGTLCARSSSTS